MKEKKRRGKGRERKKRERKGKKEHRAGCVSSKRTSARHVSALFLGSVSARKIHLLSFFLPFLPAGPLARVSFFTSTRDALRPSYGRCRLLRRRSYNFSEKAPIIVIVRKFMVDGVLAHGATTCESSLAPSLHSSRIRNGERRARQPWDGFWFPSFEKASLDRHAIYR